MTDHTIQTAPSAPEPGAPAPQKPYVGFWVRLAAFIIDLFIVVIGVFVIWFIIFFVSTIFYAGALFSDSDAITRGLSDFLIAWAVFIVFFVLYILPIILYVGYRVFLTYKYQTTWGKMVVGARVQSVTGENLSLGKVFMRELLGRIVVVFTFCIGYIIAGFTEKKQGLHDMIADSVVVYKDPMKRANKVVVGVVLGIGSIFIAIYLFIVGLTVMGFFEAMEDDFTFPEDGSSAIIEQDRSLQQAVESTVDFSDERVMDVVSENISNVDECFFADLQMSSPEHGVEMCAPPVTGAISWPDLSFYDAKWGGCVADLDVRDGTIEYCATTESGTVITCQFDACFLTDENGQRIFSTYEGSYDRVIEDVMRSYWGNAGVIMYTSLGDFAMTDGNAVGAQNHFVQARKEVDVILTHLASKDPHPTQAVGHRQLVQEFTAYGTLLDSIIDGLEQDNDQQVVTKYEELIVVAETINKALVAYQYGSF